MVEDKQHDEPVSGDPEKRNEPVAVTHAEVKADLMKDHALHKAYEHAAPRLVKLADTWAPEASTIYLVKDGKKHPVASMATAVALNLPVEAVDAATLAAWPTGKAV